MSSLAPLPLDELLVVELSVGIPGAYCSKLLVDGGAEVVKVELPEGDPLRWRPSGGVAPADGADGALFQYLAAGKRGVVADPSDESSLDRVRSLLRDADVVVWSRGSALSDLFTPQALRELAPRAVVTAITSFGLDGPWSDRPATEATLQAMGGAPMTRGNPSRPPVVQGGRLGDYAAGLNAAVGTLIARWRTRESGRGELVDVSQYESVLMTMTMYPVCFESIAGKPMRENRRSNLPGIHETKDGFVGFMVVTGQQWLDFCVMVDQSGWLEDESLLRFDVRGERGAELTGSIDAWAAEHTTEKILELAGALRVPAAEVGRGSTIPQFEQLAARGMYVTNPRGGFLQPAPPYWLHHSGARTRPIGEAPRLGEHTGTVAPRRRAEPDVPAGSGSVPDLPLAGLRVADFTNNWAGPVIGHVLAMHGADVIHVESAQRPDPLRYNTIKSMDQGDWWEYSPLFHGPNFGKRDLTLDMSSEKGRELARRLIAESDVVVENFSPRVMEAWGLSWDDIKAINPKAIYLRAPAFGISGPWRDRGGYAQTMEMASGLAWLTGWADDAPEIPNGPMDPLAGGHGTVGLLVALEHRRRTGEGTLVEAPMIGGALNVAAELVVGHSAYGVEIGRIGNRSPDAAPQGAYRCTGTSYDGKDDCWVFVAVETDEQWDSLRRALGKPDWAADPGLDTAAGRHEAHDAIDDELARWCAGRSGEEIESALLAEGVPVARVLHQHEPGSSEQEQWRGFFETVEHPIIGATIGYAYPAHLTAGPAVRNRSHAPLLGEHNTEVLREVLGLSVEEIAELEEVGVIGRAPTKAVSAW